MIRFELSEEEEEKFEIWNDEHKKTCPLYMNDGAIGGRLSFRFRPTRLGSVTIIECDCGESICVTDSTKW